MTLGASFQHKAVSIPLKEEKITEKEKHPILSRLLIPSIDCTTYKPFRRPIRMSNNSQQRVEIRA
jgi:hypothetical protein